MLETGCTLSHYRLVERIGAGGMGEVFLAQDISKDRKFKLHLRGWVTLAPARDASLKC